MSEQPNKKSSRVWLILLALLICVGATTAALVSRSARFLPDDSGAIPLVPQDLPAAAPAPQENTPTTPVGEVIEEQPVPQPAAPQQPAAPAKAPAKKPGSANTFRPGFSSSDEDGDNKWKTMTPIEIFRISHEGDGQQVTVLSDNGDKVIAPGVENSYTFKLKNTGNIFLDYSISMEATLSPADISIPIEGRISRYDGEWVVGGSDSFENIADMHGAEDSARLGPGRYTYYTLDWRWPFEGDDQMDTALGDLAQQQDISLTIVLNTEAVQTPGSGGSGGSGDGSGGTGGTDGEQTPQNPDDMPIGILPPDTGDNSQMALWTTIAIAAFLVMLLMMYLEERERREQRREA